MRLDMSVSVALSRHMPQEQAVALLELRLATANERIQQLEREMAEFKLRSKPKSYGQYSTARVEATLPQF